MNSSSQNDYQDFDPPLEWLHHPDSHVLILHLLGFRSNQLKVQVTSTEKLRVTGERRLGSGKWLRFHKEIDIPADADTDEISAKLEEGILYAKLPKTSSTAAAKPTADPPTGRQNAPQSHNEKAEAQAGGKQIPPAQKPVEKTEKQTEEEKGKAHTTLKEALKKTREEEEGSHGREEKEDGVAERRRRRRRRRKMRRMSEEVVEESGGEGYKKVMDGMVRDLRTNMVTLVLGVAAFVIVYFNVTKKGHHVEEEL